MKITKLITCFALACSSAAFGQSMTSTPYSNAIIEWNPTEFSNITDQVLGGVPTYSPHPCISGSLYGTAAYNSDGNWTQDDGVYDEEICFAGWNSGGYNTSNFVQGVGSNAITLNVMIQPGSVADFSAIYTELGTNGRGLTNWELYVWREEVTPIGTSITILNGGSAYTSWTTGGTGTGVSSSLVGSYGSADIYGYTIDLDTLGLGDSETYANKTTYHFAIHGVDGIDNAGLTEDSFAYLSDTQLLGTVDCVPEPSTGLLSICAAGFLGLRRRR